MSITVNFHAETVAALHDDLQTLLNGYGRHTTAISSGTVGGAPSTADAAEAEKPRGRRNTRTTAAETAQNISTGEERVAPGEEAEAKQDAKDEAADTAKEKAAEPRKLTHDDVKKMLSGYVQAYGMTAVQEDGKGFIGADKVSDLPDDQAALAKAVIGIANGVEKNPNKREMTGELSAEKLAEMKAIVQAALAVSGK
ncbi:hypothetical protein [Rhodopseudomonas pseudopalustris]|uniref:Uncharacterized protein n=1 Tax=Rhodopseudomonas pseudopalustris TaxID=1513892 RepID=A0A1H8WHL4_9BRAD|nr:hypothetical protein [Rhodopseudomonas pseudopalustris]SEP26917.1 hypothetical protein SAMN05444123_11285 [Rhodopseudomonas pseudopalustris]